MSKKKLEITGISNELQGASVFFRKPSDSLPTPPMLDSFVPLPEGSELQDKPIHPTNPSVGSPEPDPFTAIGKSEAPKIGEGKDRTVKETNEPTNARENEETNEPIPVQTMESSNDPRNE